jgi:hypothetical protein
MLNTPELLLPGLDTMSGWLMLSVVLGPTPIATLPFPKLYWKRIPSTVRPLTSVPKAKPVNVVSVEPGPNAPIPMGITAAEALGTATRVHRKTNAEIQDVLMASSPEW